MVEFESYCVTYAGRCWMHATLSINWVTNYLTSRHRSVVVNGATSDSTPVLSGVPQGSVLGPLLFLSYVNNLASLSTSDRCQLVLYADDFQQSQ